MYENMFAFSKQLNFLGVVKLVSSKTSSIPISRIYYYNEELMRSYKIHYKEKNVSLCDPVHGKLVMSHNFELKILRKLNSKKKNNF